MSQRWTAGLTDFYAKAIRKRTKTHTDLVIAEHAVPNLDPELALNMSESVAKAKNVNVRGKVEIENFGDVEFESDSDHTREARPCSTTEYPPKVYENRSNVQDVII